MAWNSMMSGAGNQFGGGTGSSTSNWRSTTGGVNRMFANTPHSNVGQFDQERFWYEERKKALQRQLDEYQQLMAQYGLQPSANVISGQTQEAIWPTLSKTMVRSDPTPKLTRKQKELDIAYEEAKPGLIEQNIKARERVGMEQERTKQKKEELEWQKHLDEQARTKAAQDQKIKEYNDKIEKEATEEGKVSEYNLFMSDPTLDPLILAGVDENYQKDIIDGYMTAENAYRLVEAQKKAEEAQAQQKEQTKAEKEAADKAAQQAADELSRKSKEQTEAEKRAERLIPIAQAKSRLELASAWESMTQDNIVPEVVQDAFDAAVAQGVMNSGRMPTNAEIKKLARDFAKAYSVDYIIPE